MEMFRNDLVIETVILESTSQEVQVADMGLLIKVQGTANKGLSGHGRLYSRRCRRNKYCKQDHKRTAHHYTNMKSQDRILCG